MHDGSQRRASSRCRGPGSRHRCKKSRGLLHGEGSDHRAVPRERHGAARGARRRRLRDRRRQVRGRACGQDQGRRRRDDPHGPPDGRGDRPGGAPESRLAPWRRLRQHRRRGADRPRHPPGDRGRCERHRGRRAHPVLHAGTGQAGAAPRPRRARGQVGDPQPLRDGRPDGPPRARAGLWPDRPRGRQALRRVRHGGLRLRSLRAGERDRGWRLPLGARLRRGAAARPTC